MRPISRKRGVGHGAREGYWKMSRVIATSITVDRFYKETGLKDIVALYKRQHSERMMMMDRCHNSQLEFILTEPPYTGRYVRWCERKVLKKVIKLP